MIGQRIVRPGWVLVALCLASPPSPTRGQDTAPAGRPVRATAEGPLHEAFLSPARDREPTYADKAPPAPIDERPGVDAPGEKAAWIPGYWEWNPGSKTFAWSTGTWRNPPPGRFWVNGYWKRDDKGWYRVPGFWSDRQTDRIDWRKEGPPSGQPDDDLGPSPGDGHFLVPGHYAPDGDGVKWIKGFWAKSQPGWSWVPAQWVRQPEGWAYQEGFWDRTLEDRGTLFAPAQVADPSQANPAVYQPLTQVAPEQYGQLYGALGRPNSDYDGYPGYFYDNTGRYYGYANYGNLSSFYGYLDYPYTSCYGYPYLVQPVAYGGYGYGYGGYGFGGGLLGRLFGGFGGYPYYGYGLGFYPGYYGGSAFGYGLGYYPGFFGSGFGLGGLFLGGFGGFPYYGYGLGFYPGYFGGSFLGFGGFGRGGWNGGHFAHGRGHHLYPNAPGHPQGRPGNPWAHQPGTGDPARGVVGHSPRLAGSHPGGAGGMNGSLLARHAPGHAAAPASSHPYANPFRGNATGSGANRGVGVNTAHWNPGFNGAHHSTVSHSVARPTFTSGSGNAAGLNHNSSGGATGMNPAGIHRGGGNLGLNQAGGFSQNGLGRGHVGLNPGAGAQGSNLLGGFSGPSGGGGLNGAPTAHLNHPNLGAQNHLGAGNHGAHAGGFTSPHVGGGGGFVAPHMGGLNGGGLSHSGGFPGAAPHAGGFSGGHMGGFSGGAPHMGGFSGGHVGGFSGGHVGGFSGGHLGGFSGGHMGGFSGGHMGGGGGHGGGHR